MKLRCALLLVLSSTGAHALEVPSFASANLALGQPDLVSGAPAAGPTAASLSGPSAVVVDPATGKVFVADTGNNRVLRYASAASLATGASAERVFGQSSLAANDNPSPPTASSLDSPTGLWLDASGRLWIADTDNNRIVMHPDAASIGTDGPAATLVLGQPDAVSEGFATSRSGLNAPGGLCIDADGRLWVADTGNNRVLRFDAAASSATGAPSAEADGVFGQGNGDNRFTTSTARQDQLGFSEPAAVAIDAGDTLWVADRANHRVLGFPSAATVSDGTNAARVLGQPDFNPSSTSPGTAANRLDSPSGIFAEASGALWILDQGNNRALRFTSFNINEAATTVIGQPDFTSSATALDARHIDAPQLGIFAEPAGTLWIADTARHRVLRFGAVDNQPPTVRIKGRPRVTTSKKRLLVRGSASDDVGVALVQLQVGRRKLTATGTTSWKKSVPLPRPRTVIKAQAFDAMGNASPRATVVILRSPAK
jgi:sugar lactone lactonase YvrE